jgi:hypothetical protein
VTPVSKLLLAEGLDLTGVMSVRFRGSLAVALALFAPPLFLLGAVPPFAIRLLTEKGTGRTAGLVLSLATVGSLIGTGLPTLWLVPVIGSRSTILAGGGLLVATGAVGLLIAGRPRTAGAFGLALLVLISRPALPPDRGAPLLGDGGSAEILAEVESPYQFLTVRDDAYPGEPVQRVLTINEGVHTYHSLRLTGRFLTGSRYYDDYSILPILLDVTPGESLRGCVIGMACGVNASQWKHFWGGVYDLTVDGAEIDPEIVRLGREHFGMAAPNDGWLRVVAMDGRQMLNALPEGTRYHMLVVDAFTNELYIPFHLATREFFELCRRRLEPGGVLAMNVYAVGEDAPNLLAIENTLATVFGHAVRAAQYGGENFLLLALNHRSPPDVQRLDPSRVRSRYRDWDGFREWRDLPEWTDLLAVGRRLAADHRRIEPSEDEWVLTDDRAPLEGLTHRFLARLEKLELEGGNPRAVALRLLLARQRIALLVIGAVWLTVICAIMVGLRKGE